MNYIFFVLVFYFCSLQSADHAAQHKRLQDFYVYETPKEATEALFAGCKFHNRAQFDEALAAGANVHAVNADGLPVWHVAVSQGWRVEYVLEQLFEVYRERGQQNHFFDNKPAHESCYTVALKANNINILKKLAMFGAKPSEIAKIRRKDLIITIESGDIEVLHFGFQHGIFTEFDITDRIIAFTQKRKNKCPRSSATLFLEELEALKIREEAGFFVADHVAQHKRLQDLYVYKTPEEATEGLFASCKFRNRAQFDAALAAGANVHAVNEDGLPVWYFAASQRFRGSYMLEKLFEVYCKAGFPDHFFDNKPVDESCYTPGLKTKISILEMLTMCGAKPSENAKIRQQDLEIVIKTGNIKMLNFGFKEGIFTKADITDEILAFTKNRSDEHHQKSAVVVLKRLQTIKDEEKIDLALVAAAREARKRAASADDPGTPRPEKKIDIKLSI